MTLIPAEYKRVNVIPFGLYQISVSMLNVILKCANIGLSEEITRYSFYSRQERTGFDAWIAFGGQHSRSPKTSEAR